jgi:CheY-like chemotaxis protein
MMTKEPKYKILIIDDDHDDLEIMREVYANHQKTEQEMISCARTMISYLDSISEERDLPKVIVIDYFLPGITGAEILKNLKSHSRYHSIDVLVYSTSYIDSIITICEGLGARAFLRKPSTIPEYEELMDKVLDLIEEKEAITDPHKL